MAGPGGHAEVEDEDRPKEEFIKDLGHRGYHLSKSEESSLKKIEARISSGKDLPKIELEDYMDYLDDVSHKFRGILQNEKAEHIANMELERQLRKVAATLNKVSSLLDRF